MSDCNQMYGRSMMQRGNAFGNNRSMAGRGTQNNGYRNNSCSCGNSGNNGRTAQQNNGYGGNNYRNPRNNNGFGNAQEGICNLPECDALDGFALAMGYVPWQQWGALYEPEKGLCQGTVFVDLDKPFSGCRGGRRS